MICISGGKRGNYTSHGDVVLSITLLTFSRCCLSSSVLARTNRSCSLTWRFLSSLSPWCGWWGDDVEGVVRDVVTGLAVVVDRCADSNTDPLIDTPSPVWRTLLFDMLVCLCCEIEVSASTTNETCASVLFYIFSSNSKPNSCKYRLGAFKITSN